MLPYKLSRESKCAVISHNLTFANSSRKIRGQYLLPYKLSREGKCEVISHNVSIPNNPVRRTGTNPFYQMEKKAPRHPLAA